jgi:hypothetical protein
MKTEESEGTGHPYVRISDPEQRKGGGLYRQTADPDTMDRLKEFCRLFRFSLSDRFLVDDGVSAWKGLNASPDHELGKFIDRAKRKLVKRGDCIIIENYDRLSRQNPWAAISLINDLRELGIHVGRLDRMKLLRYDSTDPGDFFEASIEMMRGNSESTAKSIRNGKAWNSKRNLRREGKLPNQTKRMKDCEVLTRRLPAWIELREVTEVKDGKEVKVLKPFLIPERAETVRLIFRLAGSGYGYTAIVGYLTDHDIPTFGEYRAPVLTEQESLTGKRRRSQFAGRWTLPYLVRILKDRRALGEFQPCGRGRVADGEFIKDYFPAVVTEDQYEQALAGINQRAAKFKADGKAVKSRLGKYVNLFAGLLRHARDGDTYQAATKSDNRVFVTTRGTEQKGAPLYSFPIPVFEEAVFSRLREIKPLEIINGREGTDERANLSLQLQAVETELAAVNADLDENGFSPSVARRARALEARQEELQERFREVSHKEAHPLSETWGEAKGLLDAIRDAPDKRDARIRLRNALKRIVDSIWVLVVPRDRDRLCFMQFFFKESSVPRNFLVHYRAAGNHREGGWKPLSLRDETVTFDLRDREQAKALEETLTLLDLKAKE